MITWSEDFATGFPRIDAEHRKLVDLLNELEAAVHRGQGSGLIGPIVEDLRSYADFHFRHEESCMEQHRCPTAAQNRQAHAHFLAMVAKAQTRLAAGGTAGTLPLLEPADSWEWLTVCVNSCRGSCCNGSGEVQLRQEEVVLANEE